MLSTKKIKLKEAYDLYKKQRKFDNNLSKLSNSKYEENNEKLKLLITSFSFIFNMYKNKNQYEKNSFKEMQYAFWQTVIEIGGRYADFKIAAEFLQHSLEEKPEDLYFAINKAELKMIGKKQNENWNLKIKLHDRYDYTNFKKLDDYYFDTSSVPKSIFSSTLYNLAYYSMKFKVMKEYNIDIQFEWNNFKVVK